MPVSISKISKPFFPILLAFFIGGCSQERGGFHKDDISNDSSTVTDSVKSSPPDDPAARLSGAKFGTIGPQALAEAKQEMVEAFMLKPDQRFLNAICFQHLLMEGRPVQVETRFDGKRWRVNLGSYALGNLSAYPNFNELFALLKKDADNLKHTAKITIENDQTAPVSIESIQIAPTHLFSVIEQTDALLGAGSIKTSQLNSAASALAVLSAEQLDMMEIGDQLIAKSLALTSISECFGKDLLAEKCLLAERTHYFSDAKTLATRLPEKSAVRYYCLSEEAKLAAATTTTTTTTTTKADKFNSELARILYLKFLSNNREDRLWKQSTKSWFKPNDDAALAVMGTYAQAAPESALLPLAHHLMLGAEHELDKAGTKAAAIDIDALSWTYSQSVESGEWMLKNTLGEFESKLNSPAKRASIIDKNSIMKDYLRGFFYSGIYILTHSYENLPSGWQQVEKFQQSLGYKGNEAIPLATVAWVKAKAEAGSFMPGARVPGSGGTAALTEINSLKGLGAPALIDLYETLTTSRHAGDQSAQIDRGKQLYDCLDSRPKTRWSLVSIVENSLFAIKLARDTLRAAIASGAPMSFDGKILAALAQRNPGQFQEFLKSPRTRPFEKLEILALLQQMPGIPLPVLIGYHKQLAKENPSSWETIESFLALLFQARQFKEAQTVVESWMTAQKNKFNFLDEVKAKTALARALHAQKKYSEALEKLGKAYESELYEPLAEKALLLAALGRSGEAITWATEAVKRQPNLPDSYVLLAGLFWKGKNYKEASMVLTRGQRVLSRHVWQKQIGPLFANIFSDDKTACRKALACLKDAGFANADGVGELAHAAYLADRAELAFEILSTLQVSDEQLPDLLVSGYRYLKRWKGKEDALKWLKVQVPEEVRHNFAPYAFISGQYELLWNFTSAPADPVEKEKLWLIQAAAALQDKNNSKSATAKIRKEVLARQSSLSDLVKHMLDMPAPALFSRALLPEETCRAGFYLGWKNLCRGIDFYESTDWLRLGLYTDRSQQLEYQWSHRWLTNLTDTLSRIPAQTASGAVANLKVVAPTAKDWSSERRFKLVH